MLLSQKQAIILSLFFFLATLVPQSGIEAAASEPELPRVYLNTAYSPATGRTISVAAGGNLQAAIDSAILGDEIVLPAGAVFKGPITLRNKTTGSGWIVIRSANLSQLPEGKRVFPSDAAKMPQIQALGSNLQAILTEPGAHHYRLSGLEVTKISQAAAVDEMISLGNNGAQTSLAAVPHDIILDRMYIHGDANSDLKRCVGLNSASSAVIDSYIAECHAAGIDSQAISSFNGPGPFKIVNNYLEATTENILIGGSDPKIANLVPSDLEVRYNHMSKKLSWKAGDPTYAGKDWSIKNVFELKNASRVLVEGNIIERSWVDSQTGNIILLNTVNQDGNCGWCAVTDITLRYNIIRHGSNGVQLQGNDWRFPNSAGRGKRILFENNLFEDINGANWNGGHGWIFDIEGGSSEPGPEDLIIRHNTGFQSSNFAFAGEYFSSSGVYSTKPNFVFTDNLVLNGGGIQGTNTAPGNATLNNYFPQAVFSKNALVGGPASAYSQYPGNFFPSSWSSVGFVDYANKDFRLASTSPYKNSGSDGKDLGADIVGLNNLTDGGNSSGGTTPPPTPPVDTPPVPPSQTKTVYYPTSADGRSAYWGTSNSGCSQAQWDLAQSAATATVDYTTSPRSTLVGSGCLGFSAVNIARAHFAFDTSNLPDDAVITDAEFFVYVTGKKNDIADGKDFVVVAQNNQATTNLLQGSDYNKVGLTEGSNRLSIGGVGLNSYNSWSLNSTGLNWINKTGFTTLALREGHDLLNSWPGYADQKGNVLSAALSEAGTAQTPYVEITYTTPTTPSPSPAAKGSVVVQSNLSNATWTLNPGSLSGSGTSGNYSLDPGTYTLTPGSVAGYNTAVVAPGNSQTLSSGASITFSLTYTALPVSTPPVVGGGGGGGSSGGGGNTSPVVPQAPSAPVAPTTNYPSGFIFKYPGSNDIYVLEAGQKRLLKGNEVIKNRVPQSRPIPTLPESVQFPAGEELGIRSGTLVKGSGPAVYLIMGAKKFAFSSSTQFQESGYNFGSVVVMEDSVINAMPSETTFSRPSGTLFKYANAPVIYYLDGRLKRPFTSEEIFKTWHDDFSKVISIPDSETYPDGSVVGFPNGIVVKESSSPTVYVTFENRLRPISSPAGLARLGFSFNDIAQVKKSDLDIHEPGPIYD